MTVVPRALLFVLFVLFSRPAAAAVELAPGLPKMSSFVRNTQGSLVKIAVPTPGAERVTVGIYGINVYNLDLRSSTYSLTAYMWLRWKGDFDPVESLDFINLVKDSDLTKKKLLATPTILKNGEKYQVIRLDGSFFQPFDLNNYPLDKQELALYVENSTDTYDKICYVPDRASTGYDVGLQVPGWKITGLQTNSYIHDYGTDFGETGQVGASKYSGVKFALLLNRYVNFFIWKLMVPLLIILLTNWLTLLLHPSFFEVRTAMPATALLTVVFLQQNALDAIPGCSSLVLMDKIYLLAYFCIALTLLQIIVINTKLDKTSEASIQKMIKIDKISFGVQIVFFVVVFISLLAQL